jgi:TolB-like protein
LGESSPDTMPSERPPETRLDSWKEIAGYVRRDVTTVQRWEKREGMPIHRHVHDKRGSVYAFRSELDVWLENRRAYLQEETWEHGAEVSGGEIAEVRDQVEEVKEGSKGEGQWLKVRNQFSVRWLALLTVSVVVLLVVTYLLMRRPAGSGTGVTIKALAVLPLKNLSGDPSQDYLADGMTEELIGRLSRIHDLRVISRTSVMNFKNTKLSVPEIAKTLRVDAIVEGSVIREGSRIRVHAQLIRGLTDEHFWSEEYDRELRDALALESEVAQSIARKVEVTVTGKERERLLRHAKSRLKPTRAILRARSL